MTCNVHLTEQAVSEVAAALVLTRSTLNFTWNCTGESSMSCSKRETFWKPFISWRIRLAVLTTKWLFEVELEWEEVRWCSSVSTWSPSRWCLPNRYSDHIHCGTWSALKNSFTYLYPINVMWCSTAVQIFKFKVSQANQVLHLGYHSVHPHLYNCMNSASWFDIVARAKCPLWNKKMLLGSPVGTSWILYNTSTSPSPPSNGSGSHPIAQLQVPPMHCSGHPARIEK